jgi:hypothetical protein
LHDEHNLGDRIGQLGNEPRRSASVARQPVNCPGVRIVILGLPGKILGMIFPVSVGESLGVVVTRVARVSVLEWRLHEREQQSCRDSEMDYHTPQVTIIVHVATPLP